MSGGVLRADPGVQELEIDGEITLFHEPTRTALVLNETASDVWRLIDGTTTADDVVRLLSNVYGAPDDVVRPGVESALEELSRHQVLAGRTES